LIGVAREADDRQSLGVTVSISVTATIDRIVSHSLIAAVRLFVTSCRSGLWSAGLLMNWQSPLPGAFGFLDWL
jgi:hypothetical protein